MNKPVGPWALVRHVWAQNFRQNPVGTVAGSLLTLGAVGFMLFFGFFVVIALVVAGGLFMLAHAIFGGSARRSSWSGLGNGASGSAPDEHAQAGNRSSNSIDNNEIEGEFTVISDKEPDRS